MHNINPGIRTAALLLGGQYVQDSRDVLKEGIRNNFHYAHFPLWNICIECNQMISSL